jgi:putative YhbY family RNA-binding protein
MTELTSAQRRAFRAQAHHLNPVVSVAGNGLTQAVLAEIDKNLVAHELIKVRVYGEDRLQRDALMAEICQQTGAAAVQHIGNILVLFRPAPPAEPKAAVRRKPARKPLTTKRANR